MTFHQKEGEGCFDKKMMEKDVLAVHPRNLLVLDELTLIEFPTQLRHMIINSSKTVIHYDRSKTVIQLRPVLFRDWRNQWPVNSRATLQVLAPLTTSIYLITSEQTQHK